MDNTVAAALIRLWVLLEIQSFLDVGSDVGENDDCI